MSASSIASSIAILNNKFFVYCLIYVYFSRLENFLIIVNILICARSNYCKVVNICRALRRNYREKSLERLSNRFSNFDDRQVNYWSSAISLIYFKLSRSRVNKKYIKFCIWSSIINVKIENTFRSNNDELDRLVVNSRDSRKKNFDISRTIFNLDTIRRYFDDFNITTNKNNCVDK